MSGTGMGGDMVGLIQAIIRDQLRGFPTADIGIVTALYPHASSGDTNNYACDVRLRDSGLELRRVPVATERIGLAAIPNVNDMVLVQFLRGDIHAAIITGRLYNDDDRPPEADEKEWVYVSPDDPDSAVRRLYWKLPNGNILTATDDKMTLEMGKTTLTISHDGDVEVVCASGKNITMKDAGGANSVTIAGDSGEVTVKAQTKVTVDAPLIDLTQGAAHPLVNGDDLLQYLAQVVTMFQSHMHPGQTAGPIPVTPAPPAPGLPPPPASLISQKVKTG